MWHVLVLHNYWVNLSCQAIPSYAAIVMYIYIRERNVLWGGALMGFPECLDTILNWTGLGWTGLSSARLSSTQLNSTQLNWTQLNSTQFNSTQHLSELLLSLFSRNWVTTSLRNRRTTSIFRTSWPLPPSWSSVSLRQPHKGPFCFLLEWMNEWMNDNLYCSIKTS